MDKWVCLSGSGWDPELVRNGDGSNLDWVGGGLDNRVDKGAFVCVLGYRGRPLGLPRGSGCSAPYYINLRARA